MTTLTKAMTHDHEQTIPSPTSPFWLLWTPWPPLPNRPPKQAWPTCPALKTNTLANHFYKGHSWYNFLIEWKMKKEYEKSVIFRLGRILTGGPRGPGVFFIIPCVDIYQVLIHIKFNFVFKRLCSLSFIFCFDLVWVLILTWHPNKSLCPKMLHKKLTLGDRHEGAELFRATAGGRNFFGTFIFGGRKRGGDSHAHE